MFMTDGLVFFKSSYSGDRAECVEVAHIPANFRKSSYSGQDQGCVEVARFRKSSHSGQGQNCVEVADLPCGAAVRDSKHPTAGHLPFPSPEWAAFLRSTLS